MSFKPGDIVYPVFSRELTRTMKEFVDKKCTVDYVSNDGNVCKLKEDDNTFLWLSSWLSTKPPVNIKEDDFMNMFEE